ncbi:hypothetical protein [Micromonospora sp. DT47]|uniref:hypothetical protein n=1 Tax=Micromonospora sp. DT47 TaxID=3393431 RepID=UPI003CEEC498
MPRWTGARGIVRFQDPTDPHRRWLYPGAPIREALAVEQPRPVPGAWRLARFIRNPLNHVPHLRIDQGGDPT